MFTSQKRIFAGKQGLRSEPFCPYLTDESGRTSLRRSFAKPVHLPAETPHVRPSLNGGKPQAR